MKLTVLMHYELQLEVDVPIKDPYNLTTEEDTLLTEAVDGAYDEFAKEHFHPADELNWLGTTIQDSDGNEIQEES